MIENNLSYKEYVEIMNSTGWILPSKRLIKEGLKNNINVKYVVNKETVGMARLITDYGYITLLADVTVKTEYQNKEIATEMINHLINKKKYIRKV